MIQTRLFYAGVICLFPLACGCGRSDGPDLTPVSGQVTLGASPLADAVIEFIPVSVAKPGAVRISGIGSTNEQGRYVAYTGSRKGLQEGEYKVRISKNQSHSDDAVQHETTAQTIENTLHRYSRTSTLTVGTNAQTSDFDLPSK